MRKARPQTDIYQRTQNARIQQTYGTCIIITLIINVGVTAFERPVKHLLTGGLNLIIRA